MEERSALEHLEECQEQIENLDKRPIIISAGRVSIYAEDLEDSIECYKALKMILGTDFSRYGPGIIRKILKEERKEWNSLRKKELEKGTTRGN